MSEAKKIKLVNRGPAGKVSKDGGLVNRGAAGLIAKQPVPRPAQEPPAENGRPPKGPADRIRCAGEVVEIASLRLDPLNARLHPERNMQAIEDSLNLYGQCSPITVRRKGRVVMKGNGTVQAMINLGWTKVACSLVDFEEVEALGYGLADNRSAEHARWDFEVVAKIDQLMREAGEGHQVGWSLEELTVLRGSQWAAPDAEGGRVSLADKFGVPPFSVLDARQGYWQARKKAWLSLGIRGELGRGENLLKMSDTALQPDAAKRAEKALYRAGDARTFGSGGPGDLAAGFKQRMATPGGGGGGKGSAYMVKTGTGFQPLKNLQVAGQDGAAIKDHAWVKSRQELGVLGPGLAQAQSSTGTSIFDPVLCELAYRWFCPPGGIVLDPFAGGSVRGIVAAKLGRRYRGIELSPLQLAANEEQASAIVPDARPEWIEGDARDCASLAKGGHDFIFSCPPYAFLERYSDDARDLSTLGWDGFCKAYREIVAAACGQLKKDRFACFVVGDVRDKRTGIYCGLVSETIRSFEAAGLGLYNEAILVTAVGSLSIRVGKQFGNYRKLGKTHQNVLVFCKGDPKRASAAVGPVETVDLDELLGADAEPGLED